MASSNVQLVRSIFAAWESGDFSSVEWADTNVEFVIAGGPTPGQWSGLSGLAEGFREFVSAWQGYTVRADEYVELDRERVLVWLHPTGRGRTSGLELERTHTKAANLFCIHDGKVSKLVLYLEGAHATAELGRAAEPVDPAGEQPWVPGQTPARTENIEIVRRAIAAAYRRPRPDFDTVNALYHPEHEAISYASRVEGGRLRGARGFREWLDSFDETFESWTASTDQVRDIDDDRVLLEGTFTGISKRGGVPVEQHFAVVVTVRDGKITRTETYASPEEALAAVGPGQTRY